MANNHIYGFRWVRSLSGSSTPQVITKPIASAYQPNTGTDGTGGTNVNLNIGDPVQFQDGGVLRLTPPGLGGTTDVLDEKTFGIVAGFPRVVIGGGRRPNGFYVGGTTYAGGIGGQDATLCAVIPVKDNIFEVSIGAAPGATFDTMGEFMAAVPKQVDITYSVLTSGIGQPKANPLAGMTVNNTTGRNQLIILGLAHINDAQDFALANVRLEVMFNAVQLGPVTIAADIET
jgi:hypothetical protein